MTLESTYNVPLQKKNTAGNEGIGKTPANVILLLKITKEIEIRKSRENWRSWFFTVVSFWSEKKSPT
jgi:hypothetical protein